MANILIKKAKKGEINKFSKREWRKEDIKHYGRPIHWVEKEFILRATEKNKIVGYVKFKYEAGVVYIRNLIVANDKRGQGVGKKLMQETEKISKKLGAHKIFLYTGERWDSCSFYKKIGYKKTADLPNHYFKIDFIIYSKTI